MEGLSLTAASWDKRGALGALTRFPTGCNLQTGLGFVLSGRVEGSHMLPIQHCHLIILSLMVGLWNCRIVELWNCGIVEPYFEAAACNKQQTTINHKGRTFAFSVFTFDRKV